MALLSESRVVFPSDKPSQVGGAEHIHRRITITNVSDAAD
jgi:hypothetical protein